MQNKIDQSNIPISGDASERLFQFLEEVNFELAKRGVKEAFSVTYEIENAILEELRQLGKTTKITIDEITMVLDKFGTPSQIAQNYGGDNLEPFDYAVNETTNVTTKRPSVNGSSFKIDPDARILPRRRLEDGLTAKEYVFTNLEQAFFLSPILLLFITIFNNAPVLGRYYNGEPIAPIIPVLFFIAVEFYSGLTGRTAFRYATAVKLRDCFRLTFFGMALTLSWSVIHIDHSYSYDFQINNLMQYWYIGLIWVETIVFLRDHMVGSAPLKPEFPRFSRRKMVQWGIFGAIIIFMFSGVENVLKVVIGLPLMFLNFIGNYLTDREGITFGLAYATFLTFFFTILTILAIFS